MNRKRPFKCQCCILSTNYIVAQLLSLKLSSYQCFRSHIGRLASITLVLNDRIVSTLMSNHGEESLGCVLITASMTALSFLRFVQAVNLVSNTGNFSKKPMNINIYMTSESSYQMHLKGKILVFGTFKINKTWKRPSFVWHSKSTNHCSRCCSNVTEWQTTSIVW